MKLISISWANMPRLPGLRPTDLGKIDCQKPSDSLRGWKLVVRGQQCFLTSPHGWLRDQNNKARDPDGPQTVFGPIAARDVMLEWHTDPDEDDDPELIYKMTKWESPPFGWTPEAPPEAPRVLEQIPPGQVGDA